MTSPYFIAAIGALTTTLHAANVAPEGTGIIGVNDATIADLGTPLVHGGLIGYLIDGLPTTVDTFGNGALGKSYVGIIWPFKRYDSIDTLTVSIACFGDGGWFGPNGSNPGSGNALAAEHLTAPTVQVTTDGGTNWTTVTATTDYATVLTGHPVGGNGVPNPNQATVTFSLTPPATEINGIRIIGDNGGPADGNGFIGIGEFDANAIIAGDSDSDGMPDSWETVHGLAIGTNDATADADSDGSSNIDEFTRHTNPKDDDSDDDGLKDGAEAAQGTNPLLADSDNDGLSDGREINETSTSPVDADSDDDTLSDGNEVLVRTTDPNNPDTDSDGYDDGLEVGQGSDPKNPDSIPENFAIAQLGGIPVIGVKDGIDGEEVAYSQAGPASNINDGNPASRTDTWNGAAGLAHGGYTHDFAGIRWDSPVPVPISKVEVTLATFFDGGWWGTRNLAPGAGQPLAAAHLAEPVVQITTESAPDWATVSATSDYTAKLTGHRVGGFGPGEVNPTSVKLTFTLDSQVVGLTGIRVIGTEGGTASGGFLGIFEIAVRPGPRDADLDGMEDSWERINGLIVGTNDAASDADSDGRTNLQEFTDGTNPQDNDSDDDGLLDGAEITIHTTNPLLADTDGDGLSDGAEVNTHQTNPKSVDTDGDKVRDALEVRLGSDPKSASSIPANIATAGSAILGVKPTIDDPAQTVVFNSGGAANINDADLNTRVDSFNLDPNTVSFVGILWDAAISGTISEIKFTPSIFFDGGWFGVNGVGPGAGGTLGPDYLVEPTLQTTSDGGTTWMTVAHTSDYMTLGNSHPLPAANFGAPTKFTATFTPDAPITGVNGVRLVGTEGGNAAASQYGGFLGVFEFEVYTAPGLQIVNVTRTAGQFSAQFDTETGKSYTVLVKDDLNVVGWSNLGGGTFVGDGTRKTFTDSSALATRFYQVRAE